MGNMIKVGMADLNVCRYPDNLTTLGLGSCIGACIYDPVTKIIGMVHYMLPDSTQIRNNQNIAKFGDTGIAETVARMERMGASRSRMVAKIAGGAQMFATSAGSAGITMKVGEKNAESAKLNFADATNDFISHTLSLFTSGNGKVIFCKPLLFPCTHNAAA